VRELGASQALTLLPALAAGFFALVHLAFALTGSALLLR
jgi:hypothetical protein